MKTTRTGSPRKKARAAAEVATASRDAAGMADDDAINFDDIPEWTEEDFAHAILMSVRRRLVKGQIESGKDVSDLRRFVRLTHDEFARALNISVRTLQNWEQGRRKPRGSAVALLRIVARHPHIFRQSAATQKGRP